MDVIFVFNHIISWYYVEIKPSVLYASCLRRNAQICFSLASSYFSSSLLSISSSCRQFHVDSAEHPNRRGEQSSGSRWIFPASETWQLYREEPLHRQDFKSRLFHHSKKSHKLGSKISPSTAATTRLSGLFILHFFNRQLFFLNTDSLKFGAKTALDHEV